MDIGTRIVFILAWLFFCFSILPVNAKILDEIVLEHEETPFQTEVIQEDYIENNTETDTNPQTMTVHETLHDKIHDIFNLEVSDNEHIEALLENILTKKIEKGPLENIGIRGLWRGGLTETFTGGHNSTKMNYDIMETRLHGSFKNKKTSFVITTRYLPQKEFTFMQNLFSDVYIKHRFNKHAVLTLGNTRTHTGEEGSWSELLIPFYARSQISRQFGNIRKVGARLSGEYSLMDYDIALNSSGTYFTSFFPGAEFCGWVNFKPLGKTDGRYGTLKIGGGITSGRRHFNYNCVGAYVSYKYKKFKADFEIANGDGYNGRMGAANIHARGYYTTIYYDLTKKLQLVARFDDFIPNCRDSNHHTREYTAGVNYFIKGQALKLILNYTLREDSIAGNSHKIMIGTQIVL